MHVKKKKRSLVFASTSHVTEQSIREESCVSIGPKCKFVVLDRNAIIDTITVQHKPLARWAFNKFGCLCIVDRLFFP